jgi:hypothetical protein
VKSLIMLALAAILAVSIPPANAAERQCRPSLSNAYHCPDKSTSRKRTESNRQESRTCRPSLSNLWTCSDSSTATRTDKLPPRKRVAPTQNESPTEANQYTTEAQARSHCFTDTVVWANTRSHIYHFSGTTYYGGTKLGAYMCEADATSAGMRAAKNEQHP